MRVTSAHALRAMTYCISSLTLATALIAAPAQASTSTTPGHTSSASQAAPVVPLNTPVTRSESWYTNSRSTKTCPKKVAANTLRGGATSIGIRKICRTSVKQAATPFAAYAVKYALRNLGLEYVEEGKEASQRGDSNRYDCSSYVSRAYQSADINARMTDKTAPRKWRYPVTVELRDSVDWTTVIDEKNARPGDLVVYYTGAGGNNHHVVMLMSHDLIAHVNDYGEVTHVTDFDSSAVTNPVFLRVVDNR